MSVNLTDSNNNTNELNNYGEKEILNHNHVNLSLANGKHHNGLLTNHSDSYPKMLWNPDESDMHKNIKQTKLKEFQSLIEKKYNLIVENYNDLYKWSIDNFVNFWEEFWHFSQLIHSKRYDQVLDKPIGPMDNFPFTWFNGSRLNYSENLLKRNDSRVAVYSYGESFKEIKTISFRDLRERVRNYQIALQNAGVQKGDCCVGYLPNTIEALEAKLAVISLGAVWSCASPDFGADSVLDRFKQIQPKLIFSVTSVIYNGKKHDHIEKLVKVVNSVDSIEKCVIIPFVDSDNNQSQNLIDSIPKSVKLDDFLKLNDHDAEKELFFEQVPFNHPCVILFSSGTTGVPKCIVHSHGGTLIQHLKEHLLMGNMSSDDIIFYYTTTGWMMYDWLMSSLATGASIVIYDGSPILPHLNVLWDLVDRIGITMFGTSAKWLSVIEDMKCEPMKTHKLESLKIIYSTGSPLKPDSFDYVYRSIKKDVLLGSITGGSDIISLFCGHNVDLPVYRGEIQCRGLGMAVECWNDQGKHVYDECGELVCVKPFPSMPIYFSNDAEYAKYKSSYFEKFPGVWAHGDFCMISKKTGGVYMFGRSDGTLNPNGVRFGSSDIYNAIESLSEIDDTLCVGQKNPKNPEEERVVLFVKCKPNVELNKELIDKVRSTIRSKLSARHVPNMILKIDEIPYTLNGKKVEVPVRRIIEGVNVKPSSSLANPSSLEQFKNLESLNKW